MGLAHALLYQAKLYVFSSPEDVEVFVVQKLRDAASEMEVPVDEEDNSDVANWMD